MCAFAQILGTLILPCILLSADYRSYAFPIQADHTVLLDVDTHGSLVKKIPNTLFGVFFEEINHAGAGGLWAELVRNRGFEAGGSNVPSSVYPWSTIGDYSSITISTDRSSCFHRNDIALRMEVLCDQKGPNVCPDGGVGISNPGYYGMNIEQGKSYKLVFYARSPSPVNLTVSLSGRESQTLATTSILTSNFTNWTKVELTLNANATDTNSTLRLTTNQKCVIWFDQVSLMPTDTYKGHGFRNDLFDMVKSLKPGFLRFPGGCFVEGNLLSNAFRWKETVGPWEERPGHLGDIWGYWTDDGLGHFEFLQLAEDLGALPVWVVNSGNAHRQQIDTALIAPFVQEALDGIEFSRGAPTTKWGCVRAAMGHPEPFDLRYVAIGNEDCERPYYKGNYLKFYAAIKEAYPDIQLITNCDGSSKPLDHPADLYDFHWYSNSTRMFRAAHFLDGRSPRDPKAFVSEYAVWKDDAGNGTLLAALAEAAFLIGLERNCHAVEMACYAPLFVNTNDRVWTPDAIVFNSFQSYGTPSYWMQHFFIESNGAMLLSSSLESNPSQNLIASAITWKNSTGKEHIKIKVVNFGSDSVKLQVSIQGLEGNTSDAFRVTKTVLKSFDVMDENSFLAPQKVVPVKSELVNSNAEMEVFISPYSLTSFDLVPNSDNVKIHSFLELSLDPILYFTGKAPEPQDHGRTILVQIYFKWQNEY